MQTLYDGLVAQLQRGPNFGLWGRILPGHTCDQADLNPKARKGGNAATEYKM